MHTRRPIKAAPKGFSLQLPASADGVQVQNKDVKELTRRLVINADDTSVSPMIVTRFGPLDSTGTFGDHRDAWADCKPVQTERGATHHGLAGTALTTDAALGVTGGENGAQFIHVIDTNLFVLLDGVSMFHEGKPSYLFHPIRHSRGGAGGGNAYPLGPAPVPGKWENGGIHVVRDPGSRFVPPYPSDAAEEMAMEDRAHRVSAGDQMEGRDSSAHHGPHKGGERLLLGQGSSSSCGTKGVAGAGVASAGVPGAVATVAAEVGASGFEGLQHHESKLTHAAPVVGSNAKSVFEFCNESRDTVEEAIRNLEGFEYDHYPSSSTSCTSPVLGRWPVSGPDCSVGDDDDESVTADAVDLQLACVPPRQDAKTDISITVPALPAKYVTLFANARTVGTVPAKEWAEAIAQQKVRALQQHRLQQTRKDERTEDKSSSNAAAASGSSPPRIEHPSAVGPPAASAAGVSSRNGPGQTTSLFIVERRRANDAPGPGGGDPAGAVAAQGLSFHRQGSESTLTLGSSTADLSAGKKKGGKRWRNVTATLLQQPQKGPVRYDATGRGSLCSSSAPAEPSVPATARSDRARSRNTTSAAAAWDKLIDSPRVAISSWVLKSSARRETTPMSSSGIMRGLGGRDGSETVSVATPTSIAASPYSTGDGAVFERNGYLNALTSLRSDVVLPSVASFPSLDELADKDEAIKRERERSKALPSRSYRAALSKPLTHYTQKPRMSHLAAARESMIGRSNKSLVLKDVEFICRIGRGTQGDVYKVKLEGKLYALKRINIREAINAPNAVERHGRKQGLVKELKMISLQRFYEEPKHLLKMFNAVATIQVEMQELNILMELMSYSVAHVQEMIARIPAIEMEKLSQSSFSRSMGHKMAPPLQEALAQLQQQQKPCAASTGRKNFFNCEEWETKVERQTPAPEIFLSMLAADVLCGLRELHGTYRWVHCDIKPENILLCHDKRSFKIADFGCSFAMEEGADTVSRRYVDLGSKLYKAPELLSNKMSVSNFATDDVDDDKAPNITFGPPADVWSLGVMLLELANGIHPCSPFKADFWNYTNNLKLSKMVKPVRWSAAFHDFILHCLHCDAKKRWTVPKLLLHPFILKYSHVPRDQLGSFMYVLEENAPMFQQRLQREILMRQMLASTGVLSNDTYKRESQNSWRTFTYFLREAPKLEDRDKFPKLK